MGDSLDNAYLNSCECNNYEPVLAELVRHVRMLEQRVGSGLSIEAVGTDTLPAGSDAYVENAGTANQALLHFGIPKGADGAPGKDGAPGAKGDKGDKGADGNSYTITQDDYDAIAAVAEADLTPLLNAKANIASPAFTGVPTVPYTNTYSAGRIVNMRMMNEAVKSASSNYKIDDLTYDSADGYILITYSDGTVEFDMSAIAPATIYNTTSVTISSGKILTFDINLSGLPFAGLGSLICNPMVELQIPNNYLYGDFFGLGVVHVLTDTSNGTLEIRGFAITDVDKEDIIGSLLEHIMVTVHMFLYQ